MWRWRVLKSFAGTPKHSEEFVFCCLSVGLMPPFISFLLQVLNLDAYRTHKRGKKLGLEEDIPDAGKQSLQGLLRFSRNQTLWKGQGLGFRSHAGMCQKCTRISSDCRNQFSGRWFISSMLRRLGHIWMTPLVHTRREAYWASYEWRVECLIDSDFSGAFPDKSCCDVLLLSLHHSSPYKLADDLG